MVDFHVSPEGDDRNPGTEAAPWRSLSHARDRVRERRRASAEPATIHLAPGVHRLHRTLVLGPEDGDLGDGESPVTWQGTDGTVVSSGYALTGWRRCDADLADVPAALRGRVWYVDLPAGTRVTTLYGPDGEVPRARGPAIKPLRTPLTDPDAPPDLLGPDGELASEGFRDHDGACFFHDRFTFAPGALEPAGDLDQAEFLIIPAMQWTMNILPLGAVDFARCVVHLAAPCTYPIGNPPCAPEGSIWLENSLSVLAPGRWVYHAASARLYYCPEGDEPEAGLEAASLTEFIRVEGVHEIGGAHRPARGIHFRDIACTRSNRFPFHGLTGRGIQHDWEMHDAPSCMLRLRHAEHCSVDGCRFAEAGSGGVRLDLACRWNRVVDCELTRLGGCGVVLCGYGLSRNYCNRDNVVEHNHIHRTGEHYWHCPGIFVWQSGDNRIADNHLHDLPYTGIVCSGRTLYDRRGIAECSATIDWAAVEEQCGAGYVHNVWHYGGLPSWSVREPLMHARDNRIEYNRIHDVMQVMGDGNGIYVSGAGGGNVVRFNAVGPCPSPTMAEGIRCDDDQHHTILHGNLVFGMHGHATGITLKGVNRVSNNILALPLRTPDRGMLSLENGPLNGSVIARNILYTAAPEQPLVGETRLHGEGRKARLRDTEADCNIYFCAGDPAAGQAWLAEQRAFGIDVHSRCDDPGFVDAEGGDFRLTDDAAAHAIAFQPLPLARMFAAGRRTRDSR